MTRLDELTSWHSDWKNLRVLVYGLGVSGFSAADTLHELGAEVLVLADKADEQLLDVLDVLGVKHLIGADSDSAVDAVDNFKPELVIVSPGIRPQNEQLVHIGNSAPLWTDVDLAWRLRDKHQLPSQWLCITGTNGKTTVTQLVETILRAGGIKAAACGNIGIPILDVIRDPAEYEVLVVELSSFQLHYLGEIHPLVSAVLNVAEDHLDWHGSFEEYSSIKGKIYNHSSIACIYNAGDELTERLVASSIGTEAAQAVGFTVNTPAPNEIGWVEDLLVDRAYIEDPSVAEELATMADLTNVPVMSPHLMANVAAATAICRALGIQPTEIQSGLNNFSLDSHRIELVLDLAGIRWIDDSKATNPHSAAAALASFESIIWVVGGLLKGVDLGPLVKRYSSRIKAAIVIGSNRTPVLEAFASNAPDLKVFEITNSAEQVMIEVVKVAKEQAQPGDVVLLAPAAASMDQFLDYEDRGNAFVKAIEQEISGKNG